MHSLFVRFPARALSAAPPSQMEILFGFRSSRNRILIFISNAMNNAFKRETGALVRQNRNVNRKWKRKEWSAVKFAVQMRVWNAFYANRSTWIFALVSSTFRPFNFHQNDGERNKQHRIVMCTTLASRST